jgi:hypothetical protein
MINGVWPNALTFLLLVSLVSCTTINNKVIETSSSYVSDVETPISHKIDRPNITVVDGLVMVTPSLLITQQTYVDYVIEETITNKNPSFKAHFWMPVSILLKIALSPLVLLPAYLDSSITEDEKSKRISNYMSYYPCNAEGLKVECTENKRTYDKTERKNPIVNKTSDGSHNIKVFVSSDNSNGFFIPINNEGFATTSIQELGNPAEFKIKIIYGNSNESFNYKVEEQYIDSNELATKGQFEITSTDRLVPRNTLKKLTTDFTLNRINKQISKNINAYINSVEKPFLPKLIEISNIKKPVLPPAPDLEKSQFETKAEFQTRVQIALQQRNEAIKTLQKNYRSNVEIRNKAMEKRVVARQQKIESLINTYNLRLNNNEVGMEQEKRKQTGYAFASVMGVPYLDSVNYDAEHSVLYGDIKMSRSEYSQKIKLAIPSQIAEELYKDIKNIGIELTYNMLDTGKVSLMGVQLEHKDESYVAILTDESFEVDEIQVAINTKNLLLNAKQMQVSDYKANSTVHLQNPNLVDQYQVSAITYVNDKERSVGQAEFNDDIPTLLKNTKARKVDNKRWLFVIGIEDYQQTDDIKFAKRSAELFVQVAQKKLGVSERNTYSLINDGATVASIKGQIKLMLRNVQEGDEIFFYYNGHGIPDAQNNNEPYMLASDEIPDFVTDDSFFKLKNLYKLFTDSKANQTFAFVDSCFSGATDGVSVIKGVAASRLAPKKVSFDKNKMVVLTAGSKKQYSNMFAEKGNRLFTYYLMKELLSGEVGINQLYKSVRSKVRDESFKMGDLKIQEPSISGNKTLHI